MAAERSGRGHPPSWGPRRAPFPPPNTPPPPPNTSVLLIDSVFHNLIGSNPLSCLAGAVAASMPACAEKRFSRSGRRGGGLTANAEPPLRPCPPEMVAFRSARRLDLVPLAPGVARLKFYPQEQSPKTGRATFFFFYAIAGSHSNTHRRTHAHLTTAVTDRKFFPRDEIAPTDAQRERATRGGSCAPVTGGAAAVNKPGRCSWVRTVFAPRFGIFSLFCFSFFNKKNKQTEFQSGATSLIQTGPNGTDKLQEAPGSLPSRPDRTCSERFVCGTRSGFARRCPADRTNACNAMNERTDAMSAQ